jgi:hypothetical protein
MKNNALLHMALVGLFMCLLLTGCKSAASTIPDLQGANITRVPGVDTLFPDEGVDGWISALASYPSATQVSDPTATITANPLASQTALLTHERLIVEIGDAVGGPYYDLGVDGRNPHHLSLPIPCFADIAVTANGQWAACSTKQGVVTFHLAAGASSAAPVEEHIIYVDPSIGTVSLSWGPTGHYLAIAGDSGTTPLEILAVSPTYDRA